MSNQSTPLTVKDVASQMAVTEGAVYRWVADGTIPHMKRRGRVLFDLTTFEEWVNASTTSHRGDDSPTARP